MYYIPTYFVTIFRPRTHVYSQNLRGQINRATCKYLVYVLIFRIAPNHKTSMEKLPQPLLHTLPLFRLGRVMQ